MKEFDEIYYSTTLVDKRNKLLKSFLTQALREQRKEIIDEIRTYYLRNEDEDFCEWLKQLSKEEKIK